MLHYRIHLIKNSATSDAESQIKHIRVIYRISHVKAKEKLISVAKLLSCFCKSDHLSLSIIPYL